MSKKSHKVLIFKRVASTIYDFFLLLGVWFAVGSAALLINGGEIINPWIGLTLVFFSSWAFYSYFWIVGGKTLGMSVWKIEIYAKSNKKIKIYQTFLRFVANIFVIITLGIPMLQIYFSRDGITLSDLISKTRLRNI
tara:strand:- start:4517 stop:4927 length:411 start_codon:yes stop_codon:yes gene_type:complete